MDNDSLRTFGRILVVFENRPDGGLRVYSDDVPGFVLSHSDGDAVMSDVKVALETIIGEMVGEAVVVEPVEPSTALPWFLGRKGERREYEARRAA
jgi:hypothetical protein